MTGYIVSRQNRAGTWSLLRTADGKIAAFASEDEAWNTVFELARQSGIYRTSKVEELADAAQIAKNAESPYRV